MLKFILPFHYLFCVDNQNAYGLSFLVSLGPKAIYQLCNCLNLFVFFLFLAFSQRYPNCFKYGNVRFSLDLLDVFDLVFQETHKKEDIKIQD